MIHDYSSVEHVLPQSFGVFGAKTPTLKDCVCDNCNQYFERDLDQVIARESLEGITDIKRASFHGVQSSKAVSGESSGYARDGGKRGCSGLD